MTFTTCALCFSKSKLRKSHLLPQAAYKHVRDLPEDGGRSPLRVNVEDRESYFTDKQVVAPLLCGDCEQLLSKRGEAAVYKLWASNGKFPLLEMLNAKPEKVTAERMVWYPSQTLEDGVQDALLHFSAGVIWKSHMRDWGLGKSENRGALGEKYEGVFRDYLLGKCDSLPGVRVFISLNTNTDLMRLISFPVCSRDDYCRFHQFSVLGLSFNYIVGSNVHPVILRPFNVLQSHCLVTSADMADSAQIRDLAAGMLLVNHRGKPRYE